MTAKKGKSKTCEEKCVHIFGRNTVAMMTTTMMMLDGDEKFMLEHKYLIRYCLNTLSSC